MVWGRDCDMVVCESSGEKELMSCPICVEDTGVTAAPSVGLVGVNTIGSVHISDGGRIVCRACV